MLLVPAYAVVVAAPAGADQGCPSPRQTTEALMAHIPAVVVSSEEASTPGVLKLTVSGNAAQGPLRVELTDQGGEARLYRNLSIAERGRGNDCVALADTVALIVERFLHDLGYELPPSPPPPVRDLPRANLTRGPPASSPAANRVDLFAGGSWRGASPMADSDFEMGIGLGFERGIGTRRLAASFSGGLSTSSQFTFPDSGGQATRRRVPVRLGIYIPLILGQGWLEPGIRLGVDWLFITSNWPNAPRSTTLYPSPLAEVALAYRINMLRRLFARLGVSGGIAVPYNVKQTPHPDDLTVVPQHVFGLPLFYVKSGLELGFSFQ